MRPILALLAVTACTSTPAPEVVSGPVTRFVVDRIDLPASGHAAEAYAGDINGDGSRENALAAVLLLLAEENDLQPQDQPLPAPGAITSSVTLQAPSTTDAAYAEAIYYGADDAPAGPIEGKIVDGAFHGHSRGSAILHLPVLVDADPTVVPLDAMQLYFQPDGSGGYDAVIRGGVAPQALYAAIVPGLQQMCDADPDAHRPLLDLIDPNHDGKITIEEVRDARFIGPLLYPDVVVDSVDLVSFGFGVHLAPE